MALYVLTGSSRDLYTRCRMNFADDTVQTHTSQFINLGFLTINALDEICALSTPATRIQQPMGAAHWSALDHVFGEASAVEMSAAKSYHGYNYKNEFQICK